MLIRLYRKIKYWYFSKEALPYWTILLMDLCIAYLSGFFVFWLYNSGAATLGNIILLSRTLGIYLIFDLIGFKIFHTYEGIIRYSSFKELRKIGMAILFSLLLAVIMHHFFLYRSAALLPLEGRQLVAMYLVTMMGMWTARIIIRGIYDVSFRDAGASKTLIYGFRNGGISLARSIMSDKPSKYLFKGFISQDPSSKIDRVIGEKVYQVNDHLKEIIQSLDIQTVFISPLQNKFFREDKKLQDILLDSGVKIFMAPRDISEWNQNTMVDVASLKPISISDLLPRAQIRIDMNQIRNMFTGRRVLITGSAGSIGSEIVRQIASFRPSSMMLIDMAETPQHDIRLMMKHDFPDVDGEEVVTSICNMKRMEKIFSTFCPDYVFHAAAYKHVPMMEGNPSESVQNNVYGTKVIADLSSIYHVKKFVMISTDKAVNPTNIMGCSKRICEIYIQSLNQISDTEFVTTRFGNVLGSNGSVIPLFEKQIQSGGPVTVTDPNIIRYFMLIPEACQLVLEAGARGKGGYIYVFDMGKPVKIVNLARKMIELSGAKNIEIKFTGLRAGEKLYEEPLSTKESLLPSFNDKIIKIARVRTYDYAHVSKDIDELIRIAYTFDDIAIVRKMKQIVPEFKSQNSVYSKLDIC